jgi:hypothetical protein
VGLAVEVGYLADLLANDEEGAGSFREDLNRLNDYLASVGLACQHALKSVAAVVLC